MRRDELVWLLKQAGIPIEKWGAGQAKTVDHLLQEVNEGEAELVRKGERVVRKLRTIGMFVRFRLDELDLVLKESKQRLSDGRVRSRNLNTSLGEKLKREETPDMAAQRAMVEEFHFTEAFNFENLGILLKTEESPSFPGLVTEYEVFIFQVFLPLYLYKPEGYEVEDEGDTHFFSWHSVSEMPLLEEMKGGKAGA